MAGSGKGPKVRSWAPARRLDQLVIVLTNYATDDMRQRCLAAGADVIFDSQTNSRLSLNACLEAHQHEVPAPSR
jgi:CheY-like chemotaxis protein